MIHITIKTNHEMKNPLIARARELMNSMIDTAEECLLVIESTKKFTTPVSVTPKIYQHYVDTGKVPSDILRMIAFKISQNKKLTNLEIAIFAGKSEEINELLIKIKKNEDTTKA